MRQSLKGTDVTEDMRHVVDDVENLLHNVGASGSGKVHELRGRLNSALASARHRLDAIDGTVRDRARRAAHATDDYVHAHPWQVLGAGAAIGLAIGLLMSMRRR